MGHATPVLTQGTPEREGGGGIALPKGGKSVLSLREASQIDFVHEKRRMDVAPVTFLGENHGKFR